ncbi:pyridoxal phosphate-dependent aminotransferase [Actinoplanes xinjiangensis]|uniref:pyridoxal phosphate-dependent aminotransferase n=1 Tax=Actinoplanes xinjiangensis TaxID=512350 RepID=UPI0011B780C1|nr:pyridoxal phosphate-dependent aminotransferase [Actinoplanes xinjiangensis]
MDRLHRQSAFAVQHRADEMARSGREIFQLGLGEPDLPTPSYIVTAMADSARRGDTGYTQPAGDPAVRSRLARHYSERLGHPLGPNNILLVPGSNMALHFALLALAEPGDEVLIPDPGYPVYAELTRLADAVPVGYRLRAENGFQPDIADLAALLNARTRLIVLNSPHNPTGTSLPAGFGPRLAELVGSYDCHVLRDEAYRSLNFDGVDADRELSALPADRVIVAETLSKSHAMCGWRAGVVLVPDALAADFAVLMTNTNCCMPAFVQQALVPALTSTESQRVAAGYAAVHRERRDLTVRRLRAMPGLSLVAPTGSLYAFPDIRATGLSDGEFAQRLLEETGVVVMPGHIFGTGGQGYVRVAFTRSPQQLTAAFDRMHLFLQRTMEER